MAANAKSANRYNRSGTDIISPEPLALPKPTSSPSPLPRHVHTLDANGSVQALVVDEGVLIAGLQGGQIAVRQHHSHCPQFVSNATLLPGMVDNNL